MNNRRPQRSDSRTAGGQPAISLHHCFGSHTSTLTEAATEREQQQVTQPFQIGNAPIPTARSRLLPQRGIDIPEVKRRSRRLLPTTKTLEKAIAAPANIGLSMPIAATGIAATL